MNDLKPLNAAGNASQTSQSASAASAGNQSADSGPQHVLRGSEVPGIQKATLQRYASPSQTLNVSVILNRPKPLTMQATPMSRQEFAKHYSADPSDVANLRAFAKANGLRVANVNPESRTVTLSGSVGQYNKAFGIQLGYFSDSKAQNFLGYKGALQLPQELSNGVTAVLGLQSRPLATPNCSKPVFKNPAGLFQATSKMRGPFAQSAVNTSYNPVQVASAYNFPQGTTGAGQTVALIELGGGYQASDLQAEAQAQGLADPSNNVSWVGVDGAQNVPGQDPNGADGEVELDNEMVASVAPGAKIVNYFAPNTDQGFIDAINQAANDTTNHPNIISISWGAPEDQWSSTSLQALNTAMQDAAAKGISIFVAAGDNGSSDGDSSGDHVDFPGSSPYVTDCGGTSLQPGGPETVWNDGAQGGGTGGGFSSVFPAPSWQAGIPNTNGNTNRGCPDVAGDADPETGYNVVIDGQQAVIGGTSAVAPLWAGLIANVNQGLGHNVGFINPAIYTPGFSSAFNDITSGNNGDFSAAPGWDPTTGNGSPNGQALLQAFQAYQQQQQNNGGTGASTDIAA